LYSTKKRLTGVIAMLLGLALVGAACGDDSGSASDNTTTTAAVGGATVAGVTTTKAPDVTGTLNASGATFPKPFYDEMIVDFKKVQSKATINYAGGGSGQGRTDLQNGVVDFAGSDGLVAAADVAKYKGGAFLYFPTVSAPITVSFNISGVDKLQLSPDTLARIFQRDIKTWDDAAIVAENTAIKDKLKGNIVVAHRSDSSGTTQNFTMFLDHAAGAGGTGVWKLKSGSTVEWPADTQAGNGNAGVSQIVKTTNGAIGYIDLSDAKASGLKFASIKNKAGKYIDPTLDAVSAAVAGATINPDLSYDPTWAAGDASYPIAAPTWILTYVNQTDKVKGETLKAFLRYMLTDGQKTAPEIDYAALPKSLVDKALAQIDSIKLPA